MDQQKYDLAITDFTRALAIDPKDAKALLLRSSAKERAGDAVGAAADLTLSKQFDPNVETENEINQSKASVPPV